MIQNIMKKFFFLAYVAIAILLIIIGFHVEKISKKQYIYGKTISTIGNRLFQYIEIDSKYDFKNDFQVSATRKVDLISEEYQEKSYLDPNYYKKNQVINKMSQMDTTFLLKQSKEKERLFIDIENKIGNDNYLSAKYYVDDSTKYYMINSVLENYINDGTSRYFETISETTTTKDNIDYLYNTIMNSLIKSIREEEIKEYEADINVNGKQETVKQISLRVTDKYIKVVLKRILKDLKKDKRASLILESINPKFQKTKVDEKKKYLEKAESYNINIYVKKLLYEPIKYEIIHLKNDEQEVFTYIGNINKGVFYYSKNNELKYTATIKSNEKSIEIQVYNEKKESAGIIKIDKSSNSLSLTINLLLEQKNINISFSTIFKNYKKNKSYVKEDNMNIKIMNDKKITLSGTIEVTSNITKAFAIEEDLEDSVLRSTLNSEQENNLVKWKENFKNKIES